MFFKKKVIKPVGCKVSYNTESNIPTVKKTEKKEPKEAKHPKKETIKEEAPIVENKALEK